MPEVTIDFHQRHKVGHYKLLASHPLFSRDNTTLEFKTVQVIGKSRICQGALRNREHFSTFLLLAIDISTIRIFKFRKDDIKIHDVQPQNRYYEKMVNTSKLVYYTVPNLCNNMQYQSTTQSWNSMMSVRYTTSSIKVDQFQIVIIIQ